MFFIVSTYDKNEDGNDTGDNVVVITDANTLDPSIERVYRVAETTIPLLNL